MNVRLVPSGMIAINFYYKWKLRMTDCQMGDMINFKAELRLKMLDYNWDAAGSDEIKFVCYLHEQRYIKRRCY